MGKDRVQHGSDQEKDQAHEVTPQHKANNNVSFLLYSVLFICVPILFIVDISFYSQLITEQRRDYHFLELRTLKLQMKPLFYKR